MKRKMHVERNLEREIKTWCKRNIKRKRHVERNMKREGYIERQKKNRSLQKHEETQKAREKGQKDDSGALSIFCQLDVGC